MQNVDSGPELLRLARRAERFELLARVGRMIAADLDLDEILQRTADAIHELLGYPNVDLPLVDQENPGVLVLRIRGGRYKALIHQEDRLPVARGIMGAAVRHRAVQLVNDVAADPRYVRPPAGSEGILAELAIPVVLGEEVLGVINVESPEAFDEDDVISLTVVADHLAVAIQNARLFDRALQLAVLEDRQRLARDLHDSVTQMLTSISLNAQALPAAWRRNPQEGETKTARLVELARTALAEMRALLRELQPPEAWAGILASRTSTELPLPPMVQLKRHGLAAVVAGLANDVGTAAGLAVEVDTTRYAPQAALVEEALLRVAQEALANVVKHSRAKHLRVELRADESGVVLTVRDDGVGLPSAVRRLGRGAGFGLGGMRERLGRLSGRLDLGGGGTEGGTQVSAWVPADVGAGRPVGPRTLEVTA